MAEETQGEKTFTQSELNAIIADRISEVKEKYGDYDDLKAKAQKFDEAEEASKSALQAELEKVRAEAVRNKVAANKGLPVDLVTGSTEEECNAQADAILAYAKKPEYPTVKDGGEVTLTVKKSAQDSFKEWIESQHK